MGAWGVGPAENDFAGDWIAGLPERKDLFYVEEALDAALAGGDAYLESDAGSEAIIAAETVARLLGRFGERSADTKRVDDWVASMPVIVPDALREKALRAVARVRTEPSEALELWLDSRHAEPWFASLADLERRLVG